MHSLFKISHFLLLLFFISSCSSGSQKESTQDTESPSPQSSVLVPPSTSWQWQLSGEINLPPGVQLIELDLEETSTEVISKLKNSGVIVICYFSAGTFESFRSDAHNFPEELKGNILEDFSDERWLDIRNVSQLAPIMEKRLDLAVEKACDGVEADNVDAYTNNSGFPLSSTDQINYNTWLSTKAHERNLLIALKNDIDQVSQLVDIFDFAVNEQCFEFNECEKLLPFIEQGKAVLGVEYNLGPDEFCVQANAMKFDFLVKNIDLDASRISCR